MPGWYNNAKKYSKILENSEKKHFLGFLAISRAQTELTGTEYHPRGTLHGPKPAPANKQSK